MESNDDRVSSVDLPWCPEGAVILQFKVNRELAGLRLDQFLLRRIPRISRTRAQEIIHACAFDIKGKNRKPSDKVHVGEVIFLVREKFIEPEAPTTFNIIYEDDDLFVIDKPPGLAMHPSATYHKNTLTYILQQRYPEHTPQICHRLDRETSGLVICAKQHQAEKTIKQAFEARSIAKTYLGIARGTPPESGNIDGPIAKAESDLHTKMCVHEDGLLAHTHFKTVRTHHSCSLVHLFPTTGRQHQLRVHLASIGHPLLGDKLYGPLEESAFYAAIEDTLTPEMEETIGHDRHALHAHTLELIHPSTHQLLQLMAPLPKDLLDLWHKKTATDLLGF